MQLPDIKQLKELLKLLRAQGVMQYQSTDLNLVLSETLPQQPTKSKIEEIMDEEEQQLSPEAEIERLLAWNDKLPPTSTES